MSKMKTIHEASIEKLEAAITRKKFLKEMAERPKPLAKPNTNLLVNEIEKEMAKVNCIGELLLDSDFKAYVCELALESVYGPEIFNWLDKNG